MVDLELEQVSAALPAYEIGEELGRGSTGVVLAARHRQLGRDVAVKLLPRELAENAQVRRRFVAEAKLLASFSHVHIVPVYDYVEQEGLCLLVMERMSGGTLDAHGRAGLDAPAACAATVAVCSGLHYAHERGVLHRDVKPANVLIGDDGVVKVTDFGIAKVLGGSETLMTRSGFVLGTPAYMAPEQASDDGAAPATDVYGAGTVLYELLAGRLPYPAESNPLQLLYSHVHSDPQPLREVAPGVPAELAGVVMRALERDPADRYPTAADLGAAVAGAAASVWGPGWLADTPFSVAAPAPARAAVAAPSTPPVAPTVTDDELPATGAARPPETETEAGAGGPETAGRPAARAPFRRRGLLAAAVVLLLVLAAGVFALAADDEEPSDSPAGAAAPAPDTVPAAGWRELQSAEVARQQAPAAVLGAIVWVLGGLRDGPGGSPEALRSVEGFDTAIGQWKTGPDLPFAVHHAMAATFRDEVVLMGGWIPEGSDLSATSSDRVLAMRGERWVEMPRMNAPRVAGAAATAGDRIVVVGGQADDRLVAGTSVFEDGRWRAGADIPTPREHVAAASDGTYVYAVGGRDLNAARNSTAFERYDPAEDEWETLPDMPVALGGLGATFVDGRIVAVGGETSTDVLGTALVYDIARERWTSGAELRTPRHGMAVAAFGDTVYALDGATAAGHTGSTPIAEALPFERRGRG